MTETTLRTFTLTVPAEYDPKWADAIKAGAPDTDNGSYIWEVGDQFPTDRNGTITERLRCVQFGPSYRHETALAYAKAEKIAHAHPMAIWSIGKNHPKLARDQGLSWMYLNSGLTCTAGGRVLVPYLICGGDGRRGADTRWATREFLEDGWFVFRE